MRTIDFSPLFRSTIGFDHLASMLDSASHADQGGYPPYNIELLDENAYSISMAVAGFKQSDIDITVERNTLTIVGNKAQDKERKYLHRGIATRSFERKFQLAEHVQVTAARMEDGLLFIDLVREIPEAMKPRKIQVQGASLLDDQRGDEKAA